MPTPNENESQADYVKRCVPIVMKEGADQKAALGKCYGMWDSHQTKKLAKSALEYLKKTSPEIAKLMEVEVDFSKDMTAGDVHVSTALGNQKKKEDDEEITEKAEFDIVITKLDPEQRKVFGWASVSMRGGKVLIDKQDDMILPDELEKASHDYALHWRSQGDMHEQDSGKVVQKGRLIESIVFTPEKMAKCGLMAIDPQTGEQLMGWFVGFQVDDPKLWAAHKRGERPEFSIGGTSRRVTIKE